MASSAKFEVRVTRPGVHVQARDGYAAPKGARRGDEDQDATSRSRPTSRTRWRSPIPSTGLGLSVFAAPFSGAGSKSSLAVVVEFDPAKLNFIEADGKFNDDLELHILALDAAGKLQDGGRTNVPLRLSPQSHKAVLANGFRVVRRLSIPPGRYQMRVAAKEMHNGGVGTVRQTLDVPDFSKSNLAFERHRAHLGVGQPHPDRESRMNSSKACCRVRQPQSASFPADDTLAVFAEIYDNQASTPHRVAIACSLLADDGRVIFTAADERSSDELQGKKGGYGYTRRFHCARSHQAVTC